MNETMSQAVEASRHRDICARQKIPACISFISFSYLYVSSSSSLLSLLFTPSCTTRESTDATLHIVRTGSSRVSCRPIDCSRNLPILESDIVARIHIRAGNAC